MAGNRFIPDIIEDRLPNSKSKKEKQAKARKPTDQAAAEADYKKLAIERNKPKAKPQKKSGLLDSLPGGDILRDLVTSQLRPRYAPPAFKDRITEDDPRWDPETMGNGRGRITEDDPRWDPKTMGNKRGEIEEDSAFEDLLAQITEQLQRGGRYIKRGGENISIMLGPGQTFDSYARRHPVRISPEDRQRMRRPVEIERTELLPGDPEWEAKHGLRR